MIFGCKSKVYRSYKGQGGVTSTPPTLFNAKVPTPVCNIFLELNFWTEFFDRSFWSRYQVALRQTHPTLPPNIWTTLAPRPKERKKKERKKEGYVESSFNIHMPILVIGSQPKYWASQSMSNRLKWSERNNSPKSSPSAWKWILPSKLCHLT